MGAPSNLDDFITKFTTITEKNWITTHRTGSTGVGKTLEDLLEIPENNLTSPDFAQYELKAMRTNTNSMLTLFTKTPRPPKINSYLLEKYGITTEKYTKKKVLHATLFAHRLTKIGNSNNSLGIKCSSNKISIIDNHGKELAFWDSAELEKAFLKKYKYRLIQVFADTSGSGSNEKLKYHTAWELYGFSFENMINLLEEGLIAIDIRIGQYPDERTHDHGTAFRIFQRNISKLFKNKKVLVEAN